MKRIGIVALLHESNTFLREPTTLALFAHDILLRGEAVRDAFAEAHHEVGGFFAGLRAANLEAVPLFAARAMPYGAIACEAELLAMLDAALDDAGPLDGLLVAPHGAAVGEVEPDFDGFWLSRLRERFPRPFPIIGTIDLHANLSPRMVAACDALIAYRTNPHLDQRARGEEAAALMARTLAGTLRPTMAASFPPLLANIERQATAEPHWQPLLNLADAQRTLPGVASVSLLYGFPYADVPELGSATIAVTHDDAALAQRLADELAALWWTLRNDFAGELLGVEDALALAETLPAPVGLLDMGDNVGGGSAADGTFLAHALAGGRLAPSSVTIADAECVRLAEVAGVGAHVALAIGGRTDDRHGPPLVATVRVVNVCDGRFTETQPRHGGMVQFDAGRCAVVQLPTGLTVLLTSRRIGPFSLNLLTICGLHPASFRVLVAKGVHAPVAAYREACRSFVRVNTPGSTSADLSQFQFSRRRVPLFPFER